MPFLCNKQCSCIMMWCNGRLGKSEMQRITPYASYSTKRWMLRPQSWNYEIDPINSPVAVAKRCKLRANLCHDLLSCNIIYIWKMMKRWLYKCRSDLLTNWWTNRLTGWLIGCLTDWLRDWLILKMTDWSAIWLIDCYIAWLIAWWIDWWID